MKLELINEPLKVTQTSAIADLEDTMITAGKRSLLFPVIDTQSYNTIGYYLIGDIYLGADTIVNTVKGAVGDPIEKLSREAFVKYDTLNLAETKSENISDKDFKKIELQAYRNFQQLENSDFTNLRTYNINMKAFRWPDKMDNIDFFIYLFDPEKFILIKDQESIIALSKDDREVIVCDKKKNTYIEVSKKEGVKISNDKGNIINTNSIGGLIINGRNLHEIIANALHPLKTMFHQRKF